MSENPAFALCFSIVDDVPFVTVESALFLFTFSVTRIVQVSVTDKISLNDYSTPLYHTFYDVLPHLCMVPTIWDSWDFLAHTLSWTSLSNSEIHVDHFATSFHIVNICDLALVIPDFISASLASSGINRC